MSNLDAKCNLRDSLILLYQRGHFLLKHGQPFKQAKCFITCPTYALLEDLIHLHCQEINTLIRKSTAQAMDLLQLGQ
jgi:hypothetical protein